MLAKRISTDARVRELPCPTARLLFTWMIAHADNAGRLRAEPLYVRATVIPNEPEASDADVADWLATMDRLGLVKLYEVDGGKYLYFPAWRKYQRLDRTGSDLPPPPMLELAAPVETDRAPLVTAREPMVTGGGAGGRGRSRNGREKEADLEQEWGKVQTRPDTSTSGPWVPRRKSADRSGHPATCGCEECMPTPGTPTSGGGR